MESLKEDLLSEPAHRRDYIHSLIDDLESDKKSVMLYLAFEFGLIVITITKHYPAGKTMPWLVFISLILLLISSFLFFIYFRKLHCSRLQVTNCLMELNIKKAYRIVKSDENGIWKLHGCKYKLGIFFLIAGAVLYVLEMLMFKLYLSKCL